MRDMNWPRDRHFDHWHPLPGFPEPDWERMNEADKDRLIDELRLQLIERESLMPMTEFKEGRYPSLYWEGEKGTSSERL